MINTYLDLELRDTTILFDLNESIDCNIRRMYLILPNVVNRLLDPIPNNEELALRIVGGIDHSIRTAQVDFNRKP